MATRPGLAESISFLDIFTPNLRESNRLERFLPGSRGSGACMRIRALAPFHAVSTSWPKVAAAALAIDSMLQLAEH